MKKTCIDCHFLARIGPGGSSVLLTETERKGVQERNIDPKDQSYLGGLYLKCHLGVWDNGYKTRGSEEWFHEILERDRGNECFFWKTIPGMQFEPAAILQEREQKNRETSRQWKYTAIGLWIAGLGLLLDFAFNLIKVIFGKG